MYQCNFVQTRRKSSICFAPDWEKAASASTIFHPRTFFTPNCETIRSAVHYFSSGLLPIRSSVHSIFIRGFIRRNFVGIRESAPSVFGGRSPIVLGGAAAQSVNKHKRRSGCDGGRSCPHGTGLRIIRGEPLNDERDSSACSSQTDGSVY